jgi:hypothetical protein
MEDESMGEVATQETGTPRIPYVGSPLGPSVADPVTCPTCGGEAGAMDLSYVYALGRIDARFATLGAEKEFAQVTGRAETTGKSNREVVHSVLAKPENRYLARQMCWVLTVQGLETYILQPHDPVDLGLLVDAVRSQPGPNDVDVVIGVRGPLASPEMCNGLMVPIVRFDQIYSFDRDAFVKAVPTPKGTSAERFGPAVSEVFDRIAQLTDNAGATDEHRALNFLLVRYARVYERAAEAFSQDFSLSAVEARPSSLSGARRIVDVVFSYTNRNTDYTEKAFVRVDVTERFPFLVTKLSPYFDR